MRICVQIVGVLYHIQSVHGLVVLAWCRGRSYAIRLVLGEERSVASSRVLKLSGPLV